MVTSLVGHTLTIGSVPMISLFSFNHEKVTLLSPFGVNLQASLEADQLPVFLSGGVIPLVPF